MAATATSTHVTPYKPERDFLKFVSCLRSISILLHCTIHPFRERKKNKKNFNKNKKLLGEAKELECLKMR
jgi:tmRNA-binding protein